MCLTVGGVSFSDVSAVSAEGFSQIASIGFKAEISKADKKFDTLIATVLEVESAECINRQPLKIFDSLVHWIKC